MKYLKIIFILGIFLFSVGRVYAFGNVGLNATQMVHASWCVSYVVPLREGTFTFDCVYSIEGPFACEDNAALMAPAMSACVNGNYVGIVTDDVGNTSVLISFSYK